MKQLQMFDPRDVPVATAEMLSDCGLRSGIAAMRSDNDRTEWPFVDSIGAIGDARAWAVDDRGVRYVILDRTIFRSEDLWFAVPKVRKAAQAAFARLDAGAAA